MIHINNKLTKSRNPLELGFKLEGQQGQIIQSLDDGYNLVKFNGLLIRKQVKINRRIKWLLVPLEWYIHKEDFYHIAFD